MDANVPPQMSASAARPHTGLAIAALIIGILAFFSSILLVGALLGVLGILLGAIHISKRHGPNGLAWTGIALSVLGIGISVGLGALYFKVFTTFHAESARPAEVAGLDAGDAGFAGWIGEELPEFTMTSLDGEQFESSELRGRRVVLDFWATWCPPCRLEIPHFVQLSEENDDEELLIIGISSEDEETLRGFVEKEAINYPIVPADDLPAPFDAVEVIPTTFFIDRNGRIQNVVVGYHDYEQLKEMALAPDLVVQEDNMSPDQP